MAKKTIIKKPGTPKRFKEILVTKSISLPQSWWEFLEKKASEHGAWRNRNETIRLILQPHIKNSDKA